MRPRASCFAGRRTRRRDLVVPVELQLAVRRRAVGEQRRTLREYSWLAWYGIAIARFVRPDDRDAVLDRDLAGRRQLAVAARLRREVDDHRPGRIASTADAGISRGAGRPGMSAVVITASKLGDALGELLLLLRLLLGRQLLRVAALGLLAAHGRARGTSRRATRPAPSRPDARRSP